MSAPTSNRVLKVGSRQQRVPPGEYLAEVVEVKEGSFIGKRRTLQFQFKISDGPSRGILINGFVNAHYESFTEYSKLYQWYQRATGHSLNPDEEINLENFYHKLLKVRVEDKTSKKTGNKFSNVSDILALAGEL
jgi:hypothetical protein